MCYSGVTVLYAAVRQLPISTTLSSLGWSFSIHCDKQYIPSNYTRSRAFLPQAHKDEDAKLSMRQGHPTSFGAIVLEITSIEVSASETDT